MSVRFFRWWATFTLKYRWLVLFLALISVAVCGWLAQSRLHFSTDRTQLLDPDHPIQRSWQAYRQSFQGNSDLLVLITGDPEEVKGAADTLGRQLGKEKDYFDEVFYKIDLPKINQHALYFLSTPDLHELARQLKQAKPWLGASGGAGFLEKLARTEHPEDLQPVLPMLANVLEGMSRSIESRGEASYQSPFPSYRGEKQDVEMGADTVYNRISGDRTCMMLVQPSDRSGNFEHDAETVARLRRRVSEVMRSFPSVECMVCGEVVMNTDEMVGSYRDSRLSGSVAVLSVFGLLTIAFGNWQRPLCAGLSLGVGMAWSAAFAALTIGNLNLLTVHFATIVAGLSMTFAVQMLCQYLELEDGDNIWVETAARTGPTCLIGSLTTAIAFWSLHWANFRAAGELGFITGVGVLCCFVSITTLLPILLSLTEGKKKRASVRLPGWQLLSGLVSRHPYRVLAVSLFISLYSATWVARVPFNYNVLSLQPQGSEVVRLENFLQSMGYSGLFAVTSAANVSEANLLASKFESLSSVSRVETVAALEPSDVNEKAPLVAQIISLAEPLKKPPSGKTPQLSGAELRKLARDFASASQQVQTLLARMPESPDRDRAAKALRHFNSLLDPSKPGPISAALKSYAENLQVDLRRQAHFLSEQRKVLPDILNYLPQPLLARSVSPGGRVSLRIFPRGNAWDREPLEFFVNQITRVDAYVTGSPLMIYYNIQELRKAYSTSGRVALGVICVLLLIHFRSLKNATLAIFPKLLGVLWMVGAMGVCGVSFNSANFLALPITLGIGLIFGVNVLLECQEKGSDSLFRSSTGAAVTLSGLTAMLGFSSFLMVAHVGVSSFGFVMTAGVGANLITSLFTLPALLSALKGR
ncbi:MAG: MMPL family transporter [Candidatus Eremiobacteraeota bacterium]|nr:MMPL family transporter [Candidatus Eremiobacteraeota bacterium]